MSLLDRLFRPLAATQRPAPWDDYWYQTLPTLSYAGLPISADLALNVSAVYAAVRIVSETVAQVPLIIYRRRDDGGKERVPAHPLYNILRDQPNRWQTSFEWREMLTGHLALRGNAYCEIVPGNRGAVDQLIPLHPDRVTVKQLDDGRLAYEHRPEKGQQRVLLQDEVFHIRGLSSDGITGLSPIALMRQSVGLAMATEKYGSELFTSDGSLRGILKHPGTLSDEARKNLMASFSRNKHGTAVLEEGMTWDKIGMTADEAQFLMTRKFEVNEFARWFNVPPHLLRDLDKATFSNIEQQSIDFLVYSMMPWFRRWEQAISRDLIIAKQIYFAEFLTDGLLRGDVKSRYEAYASGITNGWITRNEARIKENMNPLPGLDTPLSQMNMTPVVGLEKVSAIVRNMAGLVAKKETAALSKMYERAVIRRRSCAEFAAALPEFYDGLILHISRCFGITEEAASGYAEPHRLALATAIEREGKGQLCSTRTIIAGWETTGADELAALVTEVLEHDHDGEKLQSPNPVGATEPVGDPPGEALLDCRNPAATV